MPRLTIGEVVAGVGEMMTAYTFDLLVVKPPVIPQWTPDMMFKLRARCYSASLPSRTNTPLEVRLSGHTIVQPGLNEYSGEITLEFVESTDMALFKLFEGWLDSFFHPLTGIGLPAVSTTSIIQLILLDRSHLPVGIYTLYGAFPTSFEPGAELSGDSSEPVRPSATIKYSYYIFQALR